MTGIELMRRAATIARNTRCWIGIGCLIAKNGKILIEAWNETLIGEAYCKGFRESVAKGRSFPYGKDRPFNTRCIRHKLHLTQGTEIEKVCSIHAEANAIAKAAKKGIPLNGAAMYVTSFPCLICMRSIVAVGIKKVVYMNDFYKVHDLELFEKNGIRVHQVREEDIWES